MFQQTPLKRTVRTRTDAPNASQLERGRGEGGKGGGGGGREEGQTDRSTGKMFPHNQLMRQESYLWRGTCAVCSVHFLNTRRQASLNVAACAAFSCYSGLCWHKNWFC